MGSRAAGQRKRAYLEGFSKHKAVCDRFCRSTWQRVHTEDTGPDHSVRRLSRRCNKSFCIVYDHSVSDTLDRGSASCGPELLPKRPPRNHGTSGLIVTYRGQGSQTRSQNLNTTHEAAGPKVGRPLWRITSGRAVDGYSCPS
jgi:hypothetical protein